MRNTAFLICALLGVLMLPPVAGASSQDATQALASCLKGKVNPDDTLVCIGHYSDSCAAKADNAAPYPQIAEQSRCLLDEATAWDTLRDRAVTTWMHDNGTSFSANINKIAEESARFAKLKCAVFHDTAQFGQSGMALEAQCLRDEAARTAIFIGYALH